MRSSIHVEDGQLSLLDVRAAPASNAGPGAADRGGDKIKVTLRLPAAHAATLASRARAAAVAQGDYVCGLLDGAAPAPLPLDHAESVRALMGSTDRLAAMSVDLNAFARLLGRVPTAQLEPYRATLRSLADDVRKHLALSATLIAELKPARKARR